VDDDDPEAATVHQELLADDPPQLYREFLTDPP